MTNPDGQVRDRVWLIYAGVVVAISVLIGIGMTGETGREDSADQRSSFVGMSHPPLAFEKNQGQAKSSVDFIARGKGYGLFLTSTGVGVTLYGANEMPVKAAGDDGRRPNNVAPQRSYMQMKFVGANRHVEGDGQQLLTGKRHYLIGGDAGGWHSNIPTYAGVRFSNVYSGIDLLYYGQQGRLEYDFLVAPGADPEQVKIQFTGVNNMHVGSEGDLILDSPLGEVRHKKPLAYQETREGRTAVDARYAINDHNQAEIRLGAYDSGRPLIIDPVLKYMTYLGGEDDEGGALFDNQGKVIATTADTEGNIYVTGATRSLDFPTAGVPSADGDLSSELHDDGSIPRPADIFVSKFSATGELLFSTYIGTESDFESGSAIAVDETGRIYVTGAGGGSFFSSFPVPGTCDVFNATNNGNTDAFIAVIENDGSALAYTSLIGGGQGDQGNGIALDSQGNIYVTGWTFSDTSSGAPFPTKGMSVIQENSGDELLHSSDAFMFKLNPSCAGQDDLIYSTYLGGSASDAGMDVAVDDNGNAYVTGTTSSTDFPVQQAVQPQLNGGSDAFVIKLDPSGSSLAYGTYLGGGDTESGRGITIDAAGSAYVTGQSTSDDFPGANNSRSGVSDAFVARLDATGSALAYSTYLGGIGDEEGMDVAVDKFGRAHIAGWTSSLDFPATGIQQEFGGGTRDAFVSRLDNTGSGVEFSSYLGGNGLDMGNSIALDESNIYVTGITRSGDLPVTPDASQPGWAGKRDAFVARIVSESDLNFVLDAGDVPPPGGTLTYTLIVTNNGPDTASGVVVTDFLPAGVTFASASNGCSHVSGKVTCSLGSVDNGGMMAIDIDVTLDSPDPVTNAASADSNSFDPDDSNNSGEVTVQAGTGSDGNNDVSDEGSNGTIDINDDNDNNSTTDNVVSSGGVLGPLAFGSILLLVVVRRRCRPLDWHGFRHGVVPVRINPRCD